MDSLNLAEAVLYSLHRKTTAHDLRSDSARYLSIFTPAEGRNIKDDSCTNIYTNFYISQIITTHGKLYVFGSPMQRTAYRSKYTVYNIQYTLSTLQCTLCIVHCTVYIVHCTLLTLYIVLRTCPSQVTATFPV